MPAREHDGQKLKAGGGNQTPNDRSPQAGHVPGASEAANAGEVDADRDREPLRGLQGAAEPHVDGLAILLQPGGVAGRRRIAVQDLGGAGEYDDVVAVGVEVERDQRLPADVREPPGLRLTVGQQTVAAVPQEPDRVRLRGTVTPGGRQPDRGLAGEPPTDAFAVGGGPIKESPRLSRADPERALEQIRR